MSSVPNFSSDRSVSHLNLRFIYLDLDIFVLTSIFNLKINYSILYYVHSYITVTKT